LKKKNKKKLTNILEPIHWYLYCKEYTKLLTRDHFDRQLG